MALGWLSSTVTSCSNAFTAVLLFCNVIHASRPTQWQTQCTVTSITLLLLLLLLWRVHKAEPYHHNHHRCRTSQQSLLCYEHKCTREVSRYNKKLISKWNRWTLQGWYGSQTITNIIVKQVHKYNTSCKNDKIHLTAIDKNHKNRQNKLIRREKLLNKPVIFTSVTMWSCVQTATDKFPSLAANARSMTSTSGFLRRAATTS